MSSRPRALVLYRELLRTLQRWPSVKRDKVYAEIRDEFRQKMHEPAGEKRAKFIEEAEAGLRSLRHQCGLSDGTDVAFNSDQELQYQQRRQG